MSKFVFGPSEAQLNPLHQQHLDLFDNLGTGLFSSSTNNAREEETRTAPIFSSHVQAAIANGSVRISTPAQRNSVFPQYGLLGMRLKTIGMHEVTDPVPEPQQNLIYTNTNAPWSAFICGSQGGGKSHTLSCLLENALLSTSPAAVLPNPLAGLVFHYDNFTSHSSSQLCEAAYLCSKGVPVRVLVSPSNVWAMEKIYHNLPGLPKGCPKPLVIPLYISEKQLNVTNMMTLMSVDQTSGHPPLYLEVLLKVLRDMVMESKGEPGLKYSDFKRRLAASGFSDAQTGPLKLRLQLLEAFMEQQPKPGAPAKPKKTDVWQFEKGSLTIVDLSCPFVNANDACALFSICLSLFMEGRSTGGRIVALDEAHKFLTESSEALKFTDQLTSIIAQQRHLATRVVIATQEPTLSPRLLDLCNITIVHRFNSPAWYHTLRKHLAGTSLGEKKNESGLEIFREIVGLRTGEALVFCPKAMLDTVTENPDQLLTATTSIRELQSAYVKMQVRKRVTADGGKSIMAVEGSQSQPITYNPERPKFKLSGFGASPAVNGLPQQGLGASFGAPTTAQQSLSEPHFKKAKPVNETTGLFGPSKMSSTKPSVAPPLPANWQTKTKITEAATDLPGVGAVAPIVPPATPRAAPLTLPVVENSQIKPEELKSKVDNWIRDVPKPETSGAPTSRAIARIGHKWNAQRLAKPIKGVDSSEESFESESESESEDSDSSASDDKATDQAEVGQQVVETMSRQFASLETASEKPFTFNFNSATEGPPVFPALEPLQKGIRPANLSPFKQREELDASDKLIRYQSITAGSSWYKRLSFEVRKINLLENFD
ncbi:Mannosyl-oligosaccharide alpha-1-2-mannosidase [Venturia nashicola]|uniref:Mannosyl-oligosaccharide alpha-1-2-mannosidase n=1 Tax=Venturia nashicola TaxID=86259 RepID=A0A4Z1P4U7_9PEZI|nr:Mannosyl-oligosaccharide alpha-1-2-mannosidase [Venturia nashicola]